MRVWAVRLILFLLSDYCVCVYVQQRLLTESSHVGVMSVSSVWFTAALRAHTIRTQKPTYMHIYMMYGSIMWCEKLIRSILQKINGKGMENVDLLNFICSKVTEMIRSDDQIRLFKANTDPPYRRHHRLHQLQIFMERLTEKANTLPPVCYADCL